MKTEAKKNLRMAKKNWHKSRGKPKKIIRQMSSGRAGFAAF